MYEVFWNKKPPLLPIQRRITARFEKDVKEELKASRTELAISLQTPRLSQHQSFSSLLTTRPILPPVRHRLAPHHKFLRTPNTPPPAGTLQNAAITL